MSDDAGDLAKVVGAAGGGGALLLWLAQRVLGKTLDRGDAAEKAREAELEAERKTQRDELAALRVALQDVSNKMSILLDRDSQRQRWVDGIDAHNREADRRMGAMEADVAGLRATMAQLREGGR